MKWIWSVTLITGISAAASTQAQIGQIWNKAKATAESSTEPPISP